MAKTHATKKNKNHGHAHTRTKFTKSEFTLFSNSLPKEIRELSEKRLHTALVKTEKLIQKYRVALMHANQDRMRLINFRLKNLEKALDRYARKLDSHGRTMKTIKKSRSMTAQPKMHLNRKDSPRDGFILRDKNKMYAKHLKEQRVKKNASQAISKRVMAHSSSRTRKHQAAMATRNVQK
jgi:hypothetical protein